MIRYTIAAGLLNLVAASAFAHGKLAQATPASNAEATTAPKEVRLQFNEPLEAAFSTITVTPAGKSDTLGDKATVDAADPKALVLALPALASGEYKVRWSVMTRDGHKTKGDYSFKVK